MANRNAKLIERVLKDFSLSIGSGGTEVVNELPKTGKEHTVYELKKKVAGQFNWFFEIFDCEYDALRNVEFPTFVALDENMKNELLTQDADMIIYQKDTDKLISKIEGAITTIDSIDKGTFVMNGSTTCYILKSFDGYDEETLDYKATTIGGEHVYLYSYESGPEASPDDTHVGLLLTQANGLAFSGRPPFITPYVNNLMTDHKVDVQFLDTTSQLPTAKDVVEKGMMPKKLEHSTEFIQIDYCAWVKETEILYDSIKPETDKEDPTSYYWHPIERKFYTHDPSGGEEVVYEGPLIWEERKTVPEVTSLTVEELVQDSLKPGRLCFNLDASETTVSEYYVYANGSWVNLDDVGEIVMPVTSIGGGDFSNTGLDLSYFDFYINGIKAECIQYGTFIKPGEGGEEGPGDNVCPIGFLKGIVLPTPENNHYSVEVRFKGTTEQVSGLNYLQVSILGYTTDIYAWAIVSNKLTSGNLQDPMTLEFDGLHELIVGVYTDTL